MFDVRLERLKHDNGNSYWATRALTQLEYAHELSKTVGGVYDKLIEEATRYLVQAHDKDGALTRETACRAEELLESLSPEAKRYGVIWAAHAHIDMNWMWRYDETVAVTLDTFRTMLDLMREYPGFTFSQSQASVYQIVETYDPQMLDEIRSRVRQGRWEVTASTWVEADKNMPNGESQARHLLYTRRYLSRLFDLKPENFQLDFEPDTFGHHANVPEILASGGVKYYYHCRGDRDRFLYRWQAPSGRSILVYLEPNWYLGYVEPGLVLHAPSFCKQHGMDTILKVYGVGDHGGGPTRRDLERILDMASWPVFPTQRFGTFSEFYAGVEKVADRLPVVTSELNFIFTGCYTSQSRIKRANRLAEATLNTAETFCSLAALKGAQAPIELFEEAWRNTLFNQFHDIIPGSGVIDTREYALGLFQKSMAQATSQKTRAFAALTRGAVPAEADASLSRSIAEGAGVGFGIEAFKISQVSRGGGRKRLFAVFNPSPRPRREVVELTVWDWDGELGRMVFEDESGHILRQQLLDHGWNDYWGHRYLRALVEVEAPACGLAVVVLIEAVSVREEIHFPLDWRTEVPDDLTLDNETIRAVFDRQSCALVSLLDKESGEELVSAPRSAHFRLIQEDDRLGMTAWTVGRYMDVQDLTEGVRLLKLERAGGLRQWFSYEITAGASKITVTVALEAGSTRLEYAVEADWHEIGRKGKGVPQLNFMAPLSYSCQKYCYDIPFGTVERAPAALDVPANRWAAALPVRGNGAFVQIISRDRYGFRGDDNALSLTLLRSSYDPDPYPELGIHKMHFALRVAGGGSKKKDLIEAADHYNFPLDIYSYAGGRPASLSFMRLESGSVAVAAVKTPEDNHGRQLVLRVYETDGEDTRAVLRFHRQACGQITAAAWVDSHELPAEGGALFVEGDQLVFELKPFRLAAIRVSFSS